MRGALEAAFDRFIDVRARATRRGVADRDMEIDIAVDLNGYTARTRGRASLALRPAPMQVNYLGYPGTMGASYIDYLIADPSVIPPETERCYTEKIVVPARQLPGQRFEAADRRARRRSRAKRACRTRASCSARSTTVTRSRPTLFDVWMRLLTQVEGSVLWLLEDNPIAACEPAPRGGGARRCGASGWSSRRASSSREHLARHRLADLFLDTLPYQRAHDGERRVVGRLAGRHPHSARRSRDASRRACCTRWVCPSSSPIRQRHTKSLALDLAHDPASLAALRDKLAAACAGPRPVRYRRFRRHLEAAFVAMWERDQRGAAPASFAVAKPERRRAYRPSSMAPTLRSADPASCRDHLHPECQTHMPMLATGTCN